MAYKDLDDVERYVVRRQAFVNAENQYNGYSEVRALLGEAKSERNRIASDPALVEQAMQEHRKSKAPGLSSEEHYAVVWKVLQDVRPETRRCHMSREYRRSQNVSNRELTEHLRESSWYSRAEKEILETQLPGSKDYYAKDFSADKIPDIDRDNIAKVVAEHKERTGRTRADRLKEVMHTIEDNVLAPGVQGTVNRLSLGAALTSEAAYLVSAMGGSNAGAIGAILAGAGVAGALELEARHAQRQNDAALETGGSGEIAMGDDGARITAAARMAEDKFGTPAGEQSERPVSGVKGAVNRILHRGGKS